MVSKRDLRRRARARRAEPGYGRAIDHARYCRALAAFLDEAVAAGRRVVIYDALDDEVRLDGLTGLEPHPERRYALTRTPDEGHHLTVHPWGGPTEEHRYGYRQPRSAGPTVPDAEIGAVVVPGLAFDRWGHRLGRGAGYYDRFLARLIDGDGESEVLRIGVATDPLVDEVPVDGHDVTMTHLLDADGVRPVAH